MQLSRYKFVSLALCLIPAFLCGSLGAESKSRFLLSTIRETDAYAKPGTLEHIRKLPEGTIVELKEIEGNDQWVRIEYEQIVGWVRARDMRLAVDSLVKGYKLTQISKVRSVSPDDFHKQTGFTWEEVQELLFTKKEEATEFGDSLVAKGLLQQNAATGLSYDIWVTLKEGYPSLHYAWCGSTDPLGLGVQPPKCPVCEDVLSKCREPNAHVKRISDYWFIKGYAVPEGKDPEDLGIGLSGLEIYQCVRGHLVVVQKIYID